MLVLGIAGTAVGLVRADRARREAQAALGETEAVLDFVENRVFAAARPKGEAGGLGHEVPLSVAIESAVPFVEERFREQPLIEARLRMALGTSFKYLGKPKIAQGMLERARALFMAKLGPDHKHTLASTNNLASIYLKLGRNADALKLNEETLVARKRILGPDHPDTLGSMNNLAASYHALHRDTDALKLHEETLAGRKRVLPRDHADTLQSMGNVAMISHDLGRHAEALGLLEQTLIVRKRDLPPDHSDTLWTMRHLASVHRDLGHYTESLKLTEEVLDAYRRTLPPDHPETLACMDGLAARATEPCAATPMR